jgi:hypothetical protein
VDFKEGAKRFNITAAATGHCDITLHIDSENGPVIGKVKITETGDVENYRIFNTKLTKVKGVHDLYICFSNVAGDVRLDWWEMKK